MLPVASRLSIGGPVGAPTVPTAEIAQGATTSVKPPILFILIVVACGWPHSSQAVEPADRLQHFEKKIRPLLAEHCWSCHGPDKRAGGLRLDTASGVRRGSETGPVTVAGKADESRIVQVVRRIGDVKMPPDEPLSAVEIADLVAWIENGAVWPKAVPVPAGDEADAGSLFTDHEKAFWAFQAVRDPAPPAVKGVDWIQSDIDRFILLKLETQGLSPAPAADKRGLLRRVTFDLIGLPPTPAEMKAFLADDSRDAFTSVVERLLSSQHYGERWGRRWLNVVRYGDTADIPGGFLSLYAYRYRDYVVKAFNQDKPYDEFVVEQLAGDLMEPTDEAGRNAERAIATGFLLLGPKSITEIDKEKMVMQLVEEQIDVTSRTFLGLTVACARCHDHKFDPIPTRDFYSLAGIFFSTRSWTDNKQVDSKWMERLLENVPGEAEPVMVLAVQDGEPENLRVNIRGNHRNLGEEVPRRFLQIIAGEEHDPIDTAQSGRLELARWIASSDHPLTARVMVNRIWQGHFGRGLVASSDNFGAAGQPPTHPELLDWLASRFVESGWSIKAMHRLMLHSATYQQASSNSQTAFRDSQSKDPDNRLWWRMNPRRLEAEEIRDAILSANDRIDLTMGGTLLGDFDRYVDTFVDAKRGLFAVLLTGRTFHPNFSRRRSIYLPILRQKVPEIFRLFDMGDSNTVTARRDETTVAPQALFMMNSWFIREQAFHLARHLLNRKATDDQDRVRYAYRKLLGRPPTDAEVTSAVEYLSQVQRTLERIHPHANSRFPDGATLTIRAHRAPHRRKMYDRIKPVLEKPGGVRLRLSITSSGWPPASADRGPVVWETLSPTRATIGNGTALPNGPNKTLIVRGDGPSQDIYTIVVNTKQQQIAAIRLEVLPDPDEPPERSIPDLFVLSEFEVQATPISTPGGKPGDARAIPFQHATLSQDNRVASVMPLIDNDATTYWHIGPNREHPGVVIFETKVHRLTAWQSWCRAMLCLNEFLYVE